MTDTIIVDLGKTLHRDAARLAEQGSQSLNDWVIETLKIKLGLLPEPPSPVEELLDEIIRFHQSTDARKQPLQLDCKITDTVVTA